MCRYKKACILSDFISTPDIKTTYKFTLNYITEKTRLVKS